MKNTHPYRWWSEDELKRMMSAKRELSLRYSHFILLPRPDDLAGWLENRRGIALLFGITVGCKQLASASRFVEDVMRYIMGQCSSRREWRRIGRLPEHQAALDKIQHQYIAESECCSLTGHGYLCFCSQAETTGP